MREHPIPQDITNYKFHIIGNMTIKQFAEIFGGVLMAILLNATNLIGIVKIPLMIFFVFLGVALAFVPIEERPMDHWLITFFKILYKPTKFFWKREAKIPEAFNFQAQSNQPQFAAEVDLSPLKKQRIKEYLSSVEPLQVQDAWEVAQAQQSASVLSVFEQVQITQPVEIKTQAIRPKLKTRVHNLKKLDSQKSQAVPELKETVIFTQAANFTATPAVPQPAPTNYVSNKQMTATAQVAKEIAIPNLETIQVTSTAATDETSDFGAVATPTISSDFSSYQSETNVEIKNQIVPALLNDELPFPDKPTIPNKLVGMVFNQNNDILENTIVEIQNEAGQVVRAVKTNQLGQFTITTPLDNGIYFINLESNDYQFNTYQLELRGERVPPLEIRSLN